MQHLVITLQSPVSESPPWLIAACFAAIAALASLLFANYRSQESRNRDLVDKSIANIVTGLEKAVRAIDANTVSNNAVAVQLAENHRRLESIETKLDRRRT